MELLWLWILLAGLAVFAVMASVFNYINLKKHTAASAEAGAAAAQPAGRMVFIPETAGTGSDAEALVLKYKDDIESDPVINRLVLLSNLKPVTLKQIADHVTVLGSASEISVIRSENPRKPSAFYFCGLLVALCINKEGVHKIAVRLDKEYVKNIKRSHPDIAIFSAAGKDWYMIVTDDTFADKTEVFSLFENSFKYVQDNYFKQAADKFYALKRPEAVSENEAAEKAFAETAAADDPALEKAIEAKKLRQGFKFITKKQVVDYAMGLIGSEPVTVRNRKLNRPTTLLTGNKYFLFAAERQGVTRLIFRADDKFARELSAAHPTVRKIEYIDSESWYSAALDYTFSSFEPVMELINSSFLQAMESA